MFWRQQFVSILVSALIVSTCLSLDSFDDFCLSLHCPSLDVLTNLFCLMHFDWAVFTTLNLNVSILSLSQFLSLCPKCLSFNECQSLSLSLNDSSLSQFRFFFVSLVAKMSHRNCAFLIVRLLSACRKSTRALICVHLLTIPHYFETLTNKPAEL